MREKVHSSISPIFSLMWHWTLFTLLLSSVGCCHSFRILAFLPFPMTSHQNVFAPILHELAQQGHQVVYLTPVKPKLTHPNLDVRIIPDFKKRFIEDLNLIQFRSTPKAYFSHVMSRTAEKYAREMYGSEEAQKIIHSSGNYDAIIIESQFAQEAVSALLHKFGKPAIEIAPMHDMAWLNELSGLPDNPAYQIDFKSEFTDNMLSFWERLHNAFITWSVVGVCYYHLHSQQIVMNRYFNYAGWKSRPPIYDLVSNRSLVLVNEESAISYPFPKAPHMKAIGGPNIIPGPPKQLPKDLQEFLDDAPNGVIYFSLGSNLETSKISSGFFGEAFMSVFKKLPHKIIMKWESDNKDIAFPPNIKTWTWLPQQDLLAHKNIRLFITHGGYLSITEAVYHGVPVLGIPFFADQPKNMRQVENAGFGIRLEYENITESSVSWAIEELLRNTRYKEEALRRRSMMRGKRHSGIEEAVYWIEHAIKYPNSLTPKSVYLTFFQLHLLDIYLLFVITVFFIYLLITS